MTDYEADVIVIGLGPGGEAVATNCANAGLQTVGIEAELVGGECPYWGCVPSKMIIRAADSLAEARRVELLAGDASVTADFAPVAARIRAEATDDWDDQVAVDRFVGAGGTFVRGRGRLDGPGKVVVGDDTYTARRAVVVATGTRAVVPPIPGLADTPFWTNREAISAETAPESLIVLGGGAIGAELAQAFSRFGTEVTLIEGAQRILALEEPESSRVLTGVLQAEGLTIVTGSYASAVAYDGTRFTVTVAGEDYSATNLLVATGRAADAAAAGGDTLGVELNRGLLPVDGHMQVVPGVYAVGDVAGHGAFTHMAVYEADVATRAILGQPGPEADYSALPRVTFTDPEVGSVGMTEQQARDAGLNVATGVVSLGDTSRGWIHKAGNEGLIKLVADVDRGVLVGGTCVGPSGGEVLSALTIAVKAGVGLDTLRDTIFAYPTFHRGISAALADLDAKQAAAG